jgi:hypothetical protein
VQWALRETPAGPWTQDLFGHRTLAQRIARRLSQAKGRDESVALLGSFGSGKTTVLNWVQAELDSARSPRIWICQVNAWGFERSVSAPGYILRRIVETLDEHVDCLSVQGVPAAYQAMLAADPTGVAQRLAAALWPGDDPVDALQRLTPVLRAVDARIVLFIEDIDRAGPDFDPEHIQRLLWHLRQVEGVSFVLAFDPERRSDLDFSKLCDHVEVMPRLEVDAIRRPLSLLRDHCRAADAEAQLVDPDPQASGRDTLDLENSASSLIQASFKGHYGGGPADALTALLHTPRRLKQAIRSSKSLWDSLRGEIAFDDVVLVTALRVGAPSVYEFLVSHLDDIRREEPRNAPSLQNDKRGKELLARWNDVCETDGRREAIETVVSELGFPRLANYLREPRPQGIARDEPTDYFRRLLAEELRPGDLRDQAVLANIAEYVRTEQGGMLAGLLNSSEDSRRYAHVWGHFARTLPADRLLPLAEKLVTALRDRDGAMASGKHAGLLAVWGACRRLSRSPQHADWLASQIRTTLPLNLGFANDLYYFWASLRSGVVNQEGRDEVRRRLVADARSTYSTPQALLRALAASDGWWLRYLMQPEDTNEPRSIMVEPAHWTWLAEPLIEGLAISPGLLVPEIVNLVGDLRTEVRVEPAGGSPWENGYTLNRARITGIFGRKTTALLRALAGASGEYWAIAEARQQASEWIEEGSETPDA